MQIFGAKKKDGGKKKKEEDEKKKQAEEELKRIVTDKLEDYKDAAKLASLREWEADRDDDKKGVKSFGCLENLGRICYLNVVLQALLHYPLFLNWLDTYRYADGHARRDTWGGVFCSQLRTFKGNNIECKLCTFRVMANAYWARDASTLEKSHNLLVNRLLDAWEEGKRRGQEQDTDEFYGELLRQLRVEIRNDAKELQASFNNVFYMETAQQRICRTEADPRPDPRCKTETEFETAFIARVAPEVNKLEQTQEEIISTWLRPENQTDCENHKGNKHYSNCLMRSPPEIIVLNMSRMQWVKEEGKSAKVETRIRFGNDIRFTRKAFHNDGKSNGGDGDVIYKLFCVILHAGSGDSKHGGHYSVAVRGAGDVWTQIGDAHKKEWDWDELTGREDFQRGAGMLFFHRSDIDERMALEIEQNEWGVVENIKSTAQEAGELTLSWGSADGGKIHQRTRISGIPWNDTNPQFPMDRLHFPNDSPEGHLTIAYRNPNKTVTESYTMTGNLTSNFDKKLVPGRSIKYTKAGDKKDEPKGKDEKADQRKIEQMTKRIAELEDELKKREEKMKLEEKIKIEEQLKKADEKSKEEREKHAEIVKDLEEKNKKAEEAARLANEAVAATKEAQKADKENSKKAQDELVKANEKAAKAKEELEKAQQDEKEKKNAEKIKEMEKTAKELAEQAKGAKEAAEKAEKAQKAQKAEQEKLEKKAAADLKKANTEAEEAKKELKKVKDEEKARLEKKEKEEKEAKEELDKVKGELEKIKQASPPRRTRTRAMGGVKRLLGMETDKEKAKRKRDKTKKAADKEKRKKKNGPGPEGKGPGGNDGGGDAHAALGAGMVAFLLESDQYKSLMAEQKARLKKGSKEKARKGAIVKRSSSSKKSHK